MCVPLPQPTNRQEIPRDGSVDLERVLKLLEHGHKRHLYDLEARLTGRRRQLEDIYGTRPPPHAMVPPSPAVAHVPPLPPPDGTCLCRGGAGPPTRR